MNEADRWYSDLVRASKGDFSPSPVLDTYAPKQPKKIDLIEAFEFLLRTRQHQGEGNGPDGEAVEAEDQGVLRLRRTFRPGAHDRRQRLPVGGPPGQGPQDRQEEHQGRLDRFALRHRGLHGGTAQADAEPFRRHPRSRHGRGGGRIRPTRRAFRTQRWRSSSRPRWRSVPSHLTTPETRAARRWVP
jgi:hypothetical protein